MKLKLHKTFKRIVAKLQRPKLVKEVFGNPARRRAKVNGRARHAARVAFQQSVGMEWAWVRKEQRGMTDKKRHAWALENGLKPLAVV